MLLQPALYVFVFEGSIVIAEAWTEKMRADGSDRAASCPARICGLRGGSVDYAIAAKLAI